MVECIIKEQKRVENEKTWGQVSVFLTMIFWTPDTQFLQVYVRDHYYYVGGFL